MKKICKHEPVVELPFIVRSSIITPGKVGFSFFEKGKWFCSKCGKKLKAKWNIVK